MARLVIICCIMFCCTFLVIGNYNQEKQESGVSIIPNTESISNDVHKENTKQKEAVNINTPDDLSSMDHSMNPQLIAALEQINDDPSYLKPKEGELVDLNKFKMDPQKLEEMIEIFDWIESQIPPDDPQQIQRILNNVQQSIVNTNYTEDSLLDDLTVLPDFLYQVDNGVDFMKMNGLQILLNAYNNKSIIIKAQIMDVIGVATQNNPNAIEFAHQYSLVSFIMDELNNIDITIHAQLMNKLLFTLSSITRNNNIGLQHLHNSNGSNVLYKYGTLLSQELDRNVNDRNLSRAFKKLLTMISDIVVFNDAGMFKSIKWCRFMIEKGFMFHTESVIQFIHYGLQRNYCVQDKMLLSLQNKLNQIIQQQINKKNKEDKEYFDDELLTECSNMLSYIEKNFEVHKKTEL